MYSWRVLEGVDVLGLAGLGELDGECEVGMSMVMVVGESLVLSFLGGWAMGDWVAGEGRGLVSALVPPLWGSVSSCIQLEGRVFSRANL